MLPKLLDVPISTYLMVLAKMRLPSATPAASTPRSFSSSTTSAASFATSAAVSTEIPTSAACRANASLTPQKGDRSPGAPRRYDQPRLLLRGDPGEDGVVLGRHRESGVVEGFHLGTGDRALGCQTHVVT